MPLSGIKPLIHDKMYRLWRGTDDRSQSIREWLSEWERDGLLRSPEADLGDFYCAWWAAIRCRGRAKDDPGQPDRADLRFSLTKIRHGEADLCVRIGVIPLLSVVHALHPNRAASPLLLWLEHGQRGPRSA
jgi:hypothetical protein